MENNQPDGTLSNIEQNAEYLNLSINNEINNNDKEEKYNNYTNNNGRCYRKIVEYISIMIAFGLLIVNIFQMRATKEAADAAKAADKETQESISENKNEFAKTLAEMKKQTSAQVKSANATKLLTNIDNRQMKIAYVELNDNLKNNELSERAWIGFNSIKNIPIHEGSIYKNKIVFENYGRTPAENVIIESYIGIYPGHPQKIENLTNKYPKIPSRIPLSVTEVFPGNTIASLVSTTNNTIMPLVYFQVSIGVTTIYIYSNVKYLDIFGEKHITEYCVYWDLFSKKFLNCPSYNKMT